MVMRMNIRVRDKGTFAYLKGVSNRAKKVGPREAWNLTQFGAKALRQSAISAGIKPWRGNLISQRGIQPKKIGKNNYGIAIIRTGVMLDSMQPHFVSLKRGRLITQWARQKGIKGRSIFVRPHPFIDSGFRMMVNKLSLTANKIGNKIIRG